MSTLNIQLKHATQCSSEASRRGQIKCELAVIMNPADRAPGVYSSQSFYSVAVGILRDPDQSQDHPDVVIRSYDTCS